ncbi:MAG TPA: acyl-CoA dehydrogenase family protein [Rhizomicrobium sp.]|nr:acyl-CoA dehydrogenase family protein [Rhizomicrobium sp.]
MSEHGAMLSDTAVKVFADLDGSVPEAAEAAIRDAGLIDVMVIAEDGGFGGGFEDANRIFFAAGEHALDYAIAEAVIAAAAKSRGWNDDRRYRCMALARAGQIAGAISAALTISVDYTRQRQQFGKPLAAFQAIQQQLAVLAEEAAASRAAAAAAARAADRGEALFEIASAKLRANIAAGTAASIAHQVHGAIGFTKEYRLQKFTRNLWKWRGEYGNERHWADVIGKMAAAKGADGFWPALTSGFAA